MSSAPCDPSPDTAAPPRDLKARLIAQIASNGPMSVAAYMAEALYDPRSGYYATKDPIGAGADYITAPEISPMFGELVGLWCVDEWMRMGGPARFRLIELGPGRGTLMADVIRAARVRPAFIDSLAITLVEISPALQGVQAQTVGGTSIPVEWLSQAPADGVEPCIVLANEFLDCLPVRQFVRLDGAWRERCVGIDPNDPNALAFVFAAAPLAERDVALIPQALRGQGDGTVVEAAPGLTGLVERLGQRLNRHGGRALIVDYGPAGPEPGDTLQALQAHAKVAPLDRPGEADLTARVSFAAVAQAGAAAGLTVHGPVAQGVWLRRLGLEARAAALLAAHPSAKTKLASQVLRLSDETEMGALFKVMCLSAPGLGAPAGFEEDQTP